MLKEYLKKRTLIHKGKAVSFYSDEVVLPNKKTTRREYLKHPGAVAALAFLNKKDIVLVRQYRYPIGKITLELPAGKMSPRENPLSCIKRELAEETGFRALRWKRLFTYYPSCAFSTEALHIYQASSLRPSDGRPDEDEFLERVIMPFREALRLVKREEINDAKTVIALLLAEGFLKSS